MPNVVRLALASVTLLFLAALPHAAVAQGNGADLNISPKRLVLGGTSRTAVVYVFNRGTSGASYAIDLADRVMLEDGQIMALDDVKPDTPAAQTAARMKTARTMISFSPRRVVLGPGESQTIRVRLLQPAGLAAGEYRTHLTVATLPPEDTGLTAEQAVTLAEGQLSTRVVALLALSIPLIVRQDVTVGAASIEGARVERLASPEPDGPPARVDLTLVRAGAGSIYGNLEIIARKGNASEMIGVVKGIAVYPEIARRAVSVGLARAPLQGEKLTIQMIDDDGSPGAVLARAEVDGQ